MKKRILASILTLAMAMGLLAGCGGDKSQGGGGGGGSAVAQGPVKLTVWGPQEEQELLQEMCEAFAAAHTEKEYSFEYGVVGENDAQARYSEDPAAAADVFMFANDHLRNFVNSKSLYEVTRNKDDVVARNDDGSVEAASMDGALYAYPMTADNGYFMYYDKSVFSEEDVKSLDKMMDVAQAADKQVLMDVSNGWYIVSFFFGAGCTLGLDEEGNGVSDFNNEKGVAAAEAIKAFTAHPAFVTGDDSVLTGGMGGSLAAGISGTWNAAPLMEKLGDNFGAVKLPTFTLGSQQVQMSSFGGYKLVGVNSLTSFPVDAMDLADWLTNEENQQRRFEVRAIGPSNKKVAEGDAVKANLALSALATQNQFAVPQRDVPGSFWDPAEAFGAAMEAKDYSTPIEQMLDTLVDQIEG